MLLLGLQRFEHHLNTHDNATAFRRNTNTRKNPTISSTFNNDRTLEMMMAHLRLQFMMDGIYDEWSWVDCKMFLSHVYIYNGLRDSIEIMRIIQTIQFIVCRMGGIKKTGEWEWKKKKTKKSGPSSIPTFVCSVKWLESSVGEIH